jgi:hypothetical protein
MPETNPFRNGTVNANILLGSKPLFPQERLLSREINCIFSHVKYCMRIICNIW